MQLSSKIVSVAGFTGYTQLVPHGVEPVMPHSLKNRSGPARKATTTRTRNSQV